MADLDLLRDVNNTYGHLAGDTVLAGVANVFREQLRSYDVPARFGGEEFSILLPETPPRRGSRDRRADPPRGRGARVRGRDLERADPCHDLGRRRLLPPRRPERERARAPSRPRRLSREAPGAKPCPRRLERAGARSAREPRAAPRRSPRRRRRSLCGRTRRPGHTSSGYHGASPSSSRWSARQGSRSESSQGSRGRAGASQA